jgi:hypothetical protein
VVLPEFAFIHYLKAMQSQGGEYTQFKDWFEALEFMEDLMDEIDYEVAIIGCGAYGMSLAAHAKRNGKVAIHLGGWTQMLFGVYGKRWILDQPKYAQIINSYWIRPNKNERIKNLAKIEGGCYW